MALCGALRRAHSPAGVYPCRAPRDRTERHTAREHNSGSRTLELDGQTLARKQYPLMQAEGRRRGTPLAGKEGT